MSIAVTYKNYHIEQKPGTEKFVLIDSNGNMFCDNMGCIQEFNSVDEAKQYIDEYVCE